MISIENIFNDDIIKPEDYEWHISSGSSRFGTHYISRKSDPHIGNWIYLHNDGTESDICGIEGWYSSYEDAQEVLYTHLGILNPNFIEESEMEL